LSRQFLNVKGLKKSRALISAISHFRNCRHYLAHNRIDVGKKKKRRYRRILYADRGEGRENYLKRSKLSS